MNVRNLHWIVIEDSAQRSSFVTSLLSRMPFATSHLAATSTAGEKSKVRGASQRNAGLKLLLKNPNTLHDDDVIYFADDDNSYDVRLFDEIRRTQRVGVLPVGFMRALPFSSPVVGGGKVLEFLDHFPAERTFQMDLAGFAVNAGFWRSRGAQLFVARKVGYLEDDFLKALKVTLDELQPLADNCTQVLVWHTKTTGSSTARGTMQKARRNFAKTNVETLVNQFM